MSIKSPSMIARWHPIDGTALRPRHGRHRPATQGLRPAIWVFLLLRPSRPQAVGLV